MKNVNINEYKATDCGRIGKAFERSCTNKNKVKAAGKVDWYHLGETFENKIGAGELGKPHQKLLGGVKKVLYVPVPVVDEDGTLDPYKQEGFILDRKTFLEVLESVGLIREKTSTAGIRKVTIQTFWNRKENKPHGTKYYKLLDALYESCEETLEEHLERLGH